MGYQMTSILYLWLFTFLIHNQNLNFIIVMIRNFILLRSFSHTVEPFIQPYATYRLPALTRFLKSNKTYKGQYNEEGMQAFKERHPNIKIKQLIANKSIGVSDIGLGTYQGSLDESDDIIQFNAIIDSVLLGVNVIDTCSNFRGGRSQVILGAALRYLIEQKKYERNNLMLMSKVGYVRQKLPQQLQNQIINGHCVHPTYLQQSLNQSLESIGVEKLDVFYLNNFAECQLENLGRDKFYDKLSRAFEFLEKMRRENKIGNYGLASWEAFRVGPENSKHLNLRDLVELAEKICGKNNGFKFAQVPINIMMPEIFAEKNQQFGSFLETAEALKINVISCSPLLSGSLVNIPLPTNKLSCRHNGAKHLQLIRSIPASSLTCSLIGHKANRHVKKNLQVLNVPALSEDQWFEIFVPSEKVGEKIN